MAIIIISTCTAAVPVECAAYAAGSGGTYLFVGNSRDGPEITDVRRVVRRPVSAAQPPRSVSWQDLGRGIFWPRETDQNFFISDPKLPTSIVTMKVQGNGGFPSGDTNCRSMVISLSGSVAPSGADAAESHEHANSIRAMVVAGEGEALICKGETMPRAATMRIARRVLPALWDAGSVDEELVSEIEVAWALAP